jgi:gluconate 2-dehydrogenase gamma chain
VNNSEHFSRRQFVRESVSGIGAVWFAARWPAIVAAQQEAQRTAESEAPSSQFFSVEQAREIEAITAQIIPSNETPGAREAHCVYFIDRVLLTLERDKQSIYVKGLQFLDRKTRERFPSASSFSTLNSEQQIELLTTIENSEFFELVRYHTIVGFLANPEYGGNYNQTGWKLIGFEDDMHFEPPFGFYDAEENKAG